MVCLNSKHLRLSKDKAPDKAAQKDSAMNENLQFIFSRRSIRKYLDQQIDEKTITDLLEAAMAAPSAVAKDPWHFIVLRKRGTLDKLAELLPNGQMLRQAPLGILVCGDMHKAHDQQESYMLQDLSAAVENMLLAATALGLGGCWLGVHPRKERMEGVRLMFRLPDGIIPFCAVSLGWPAEHPKARTRYNHQCVHDEAW